MLYQVYQAHTDIMIPVRAWAGSALKAIGLPLVGVTDNAVLRNLTAAYELLTRTDIMPLVLERSTSMGGLSRTVNYKGNRMDIGGHRFFSKSDRVMEWWLNILPLQPGVEREFEISYRNQKRTVTRGAARATGADGVIYALGGMILIAFAIWLLRLGSGASFTAWLRRGLAAAAVLLAFAAAFKLDDTPATAASASGGPSAGVSFDGWERFSRARMTEAAAAGKPVFVDFTAAWCITCLVNERVALETPGTRRAFEQAGVVKLKGDWTNRDPEITATLKEAGRAGVPLYLFWPPGAERPKILPQVLTEATIAAELSSIPQAKR